MIRPAPSDIRAARAAAGLTQTEAAALIYCGLRTWQGWEAGTRHIHPAMWELWVIKATGKFPDGSALQFAQPSASVRE